MVKNREIVTFENPIYQKKSFTIFHHNFYFIIFCLSNTGTLVVLMKTNSIDV